MDLEKIIRDGVTIMVGIFSVTLFVIVRVLMGYGVNFQVTEICSPPVDNTIYEHLMTHKLPG